ncbi:MAG TPA: AGE family epimerase/isomerase [Puia sp.]|nr:AGE family epimerase/isomerase [Puia sp.]
MTAAAYRDEATRELQSILEYWMLNTPDERRGGFIGRVDENDRPHEDAPKGLVLNARILWTFSAAWRTTGRWIYRPVATRAYEYLMARFIDKEYGGAYWSVTASGEPLNTRKQIYGQAFALYGLSEYYRAIGDQCVLDQAIDFYRLIEQHSYDSRYGGYSEAFDRDWTSLDDLRLSEKDANEKKTMNTHLHVLEAYANLYQVWPNEGLRKRIGQLLDLFLLHIVDKGTGHLGLFFTERWEPRSTMVSYGHDIEAGWLLHEAALVIEDGQRAHRLARLALQLATVVEEGLDVDGGLWYEQAGGQLIREKHWWPQAEAMVGYLRAWRVSGDLHWWQRSTAVWDFVKRYLRHPQGKEWYWGVTGDHMQMPGEDKAGFWKCPYHNSRACLEIMRMLGG